MRNTFRWLSSTTAKKSVIQIVCVQLKKGEEKNTPCGRNKNSFDSILDPDECKNKFMECAGRAHDSVDRANDDRITLWLISMRTHTKEHTFFCWNGSNHLMIFFYCVTMSHTLADVPLHERIFARALLCVRRDILGYSYLRLLFVWKLILAARLRSSFFSLLYPFVGIVTIFVCPCLPSYTNAHFKCSHRNYHKQQ